MRIDAAPGIEMACGAIQEITRWTKGPGERHQHQYQIHQSNQKVVVVVVTKKRQLTRAAVTAVTQRDLITLEAEEPSQTILTLVTIRGAYITISLYLITK